MYFSRLASSFAACLLTIGSLSAQQSVSSSSPDAQPSPTAGVSSCNPWCYMAPLGGDMSLKQRTCYQVATLATPYLALRGAAMAGFGTWRDSNNAMAKNREGFAPRYASFYARHSARAAGELVAGYFNHEDPRPHLSLEHGTWNRTRSALLSVVRVQNASGQSRPAFAPLAGSLSSGMVGMALSPNRSSWNSAFVRSELTYSTYFATALAREFKPDLTQLANHIRHKKNKG